MEADQLVKEISDIANTIPFIESLINNRNITSSDDRSYLGPLVSRLKKRAVKKGIVLSTIILAEENEN